MARSETKKAKAAQTEPAPEAVKPDSEAGGGPKGGGKRDLELVVKPISIDKDARVAMREARSIARDASKSAAEKSAAAVAVALMLNSRDQVDVLDRADAADELEKLLEEVNHALEVAEKRQAELTESNSSYVELMQDGLKERANLLDRLDLAERMDASLRADLKVALQRASEAERASADARARLDALAPDAMLSEVAGAIAELTGAVKSIPPAPQVDLAGPVDQIITRLSSDIAGTVHMLAAHAAKVRSDLNATESGLHLRMDALDQAASSRADVATKAIGESFGTVSFGLTGLLETAMAAEKARQAQHTALLERIDAMEQVLTVAIAKLR